jgi:nitrogen regulatory protein PII
MVLITIVCQERLIPSLVELLRRRGATGYTITNVQGLSFGKDESQQQRFMLQVVVPHEEADHILDDIIQRDYHSDSFVLWTTEVEVLRRGRFVR